MADPAPFVVANPGSGTTLLRMMLDAHSDLAIPPETHFIPDVIQRAREIRTREGRKPAARELVDVLVANRRWSDFGLDDDELCRRLGGEGETVTARRLLRRFYGLYAERQGKSRWGDKTPEYLLHTTRIARTLPEARFVHLVRDGRDVAVSRRRWRERAGAEPGSVERWASQWRRWILDGREQGQATERYLEVRYEDLVTDTEPTLRRICEFAEVEFEGGMLEYHERSAERLRELDHALPAADGKGAREAAHRQAKHALTAAPPQRSKLEQWRSELTEAEVAAFEAEAGDLLEELGYPVEARA
jgi:hypothetical protein